MATKELVFAACCAACGEVEKLPLDAAIDAAPDALVCTTPEMACSGSCLDVSMDRMHCGSCTQVCTSSQGCLDSACVDANASCVVIHRLGPTMPSGVYTHSDGTKFYCDMQNGLNGGQPPTQYDQLGIGRYNVTYPNQELLSGAMLTDPALQQAFIALYNFQSGGIGLETFTASNVCVTTSPLGGRRMGWGATIVFGPSTTTLGMPTLVTESPPTSSTTPPLPASFFATNAPSDVTNCADNNNPAFFINRH